MNISILEDNAIVCEMLTTALSLRGHCVRTYASAFALLEAFEQAQNMFADVLLVDEMLPGGMTGSEAVQQLQFLHPDIPPVVFITGAGPVRIQQIEDTFPNTTILTKPLHIRVLLQTIEKRKLFS